MIGQVYWPAAPLRGSPQLGATAGATAGEGATLANTTHCVRGNTLPSQKRRVVKVITPAGRATAGP